MVYELLLKNLITNNPEIKLGNAKGTILGSPFLGKPPGVLPAEPALGCCSLVAGSPDARTLPVLSLGICFYQGGETSWCMELGPCGSKLQQGNMQTKQLTFTFSAIL